jgi:hypothetical protein
MEKLVKTPKTQQSLQDDPVERDSEIEQEFARRKKKQKLNNKRLVYLKKSESNVFRAS